MKIEKVYYRVKTGSGYIGIYNTHDEAMDAVNECHESGEKDVCVETVTEKHYKCKEVCDIKSYKDACGRLGIPEVRFKDVGDSLSVRNMAFIKLGSIVDAANEGWNPDWEAIHEDKYYPKFTKSPLTWKLEFFGVCNLSNLCYAPFHFKSKEIAEYVAKEFIDLYRALYGCDTEKSVLSL